MNLKPSNFCKLCALLLALMLALTGCRGNEATIVPKPIDDNAGSQTNALQEADYLRPGYYAPNAAMNAEAPVVPVPAPATIEEIREAAQQAAILNPGYEQASEYTIIERGDINIGLVIEDSASINPLRCRSIDMMNLNTLAFESLVALDANHMPTPLLADRWEVSGDTWTFTLRSNVSFHDGSMLTPEDVVASYNELKRDSGNYWSPMLSLIKSVQSVNENTLRVKSTCGYMTLFAMTFPIVSRNSIESETPYGTGPYLIVQYDLNNAIRLQANPLWWKRSTGEIQSVVGLYYLTVKQAVQALERNEIDTLASEYPTASINRSLSDRMTLDYATTTYECIVPNLRHPVLRDKAVREALMYAIDRTTLAGTVFTGMVQESEVPVVPGSWLYEPQAARYNYNPERALQILRDAGWSDPGSTGTLQGVVDGSLTKLKLNLLTYDRGTTSTRSEAAQAIAEQLKLVGFDIQISKLSYGDAHRTMLEGKFDLALVAFELSDVPNLAFMLASSGESNYMRYKSGEMDRQLRAAYEARSSEALQTAMSKIQLEVVDELPILGLFFRNGVLVSKTSVRGLSGLRRGYVLSGIAKARPDS